MECQQCGYVMDAFQQDCPKCARAKTIKPRTVSGQVEKPLTAVRAKETVKDVASSFQIIPWIRIEEPEQGWPMAIALWTVMGINGLLVLAVAVIYAILHSKGEESGVLFFFLLFPLLSILAAWAMLTYRRWAFRLLLGTTVAPGALAVYNGNWQEPLVFIIVMLPAIAGVVAILIGFSRWEEFE